MSNVSLGVCLGSLVAKLPSLIISHQLSPVSTVLHPPARTLSLSHAHAVSLGNTPPLCPGLAFSHNLSH